MKKFLCLALMAALMMALATTAFAATGTATVTADGTLTYSASDIEGWVEIYAGDVDGNPIAIHGEEVKDAVIEGTNLKAGDYLSYADLKSTTKVVIEEPDDTPAYTVTFDETTGKGKIEKTSKTPLKTPYIRYVVSYFDTRLGEQEGKGFRFSIPVAADGTFSFADDANAAMVVNMRYFEVVDNSDTLKFDTATGKYAVYGKLLITK